MKTTSKGLRLAMAMAAASVVLASASSAAAATGIAAKTAAVTSHNLTAKGGDHTKVLFSCPSSDLCFWVNANMGGAEGFLQGTNPWWGDFAQSECVPPAAAADAHGTWNDCASSLWDAGDSATVPYAVLYQNINYGGGAYCFAPGTGSANLTQVHYRVNGKPISATLNDSISSNTWVPEHNCGLIDNG